MGFLEIQIDVRTRDVMAGARGGTGPVQDVRHQPEGTNLLPNVRNVMPAIIYLELSTHVTKELTFVV
jgi:hypothetical protein